MRMHTTLTSNSYHSQYVWFIRPLIQIHNRDQQWIIFSLLLSAHEMLNLCESKILKFNYVRTVITILQSELLAEFLTPLMLCALILFNYVLRTLILQRWSIQVAMSMHTTLTSKSYTRNMFDSYAYSFRFITEISNELSFFSTNKHSWNFESKRVNDIEI